MYDIEHWLSTDGTKTKSPFYNSKKGSTSVCVGTAYFELYTDGRIVASNDKRELKTVDDLTEKELETLNSIVPKS